MTKLCCRSNISAYAILLSFLFVSSAFSAILTVNSGSGGGDYAEGAVVPITADAAPLGQEFDLWVANSGSPIIDGFTSSSTTLTMPATAATVTATYKALINSLSGTVSFSGSGFAGVTLTIDDGTSDTTLTTDASGVYTFTGPAGSYTVTPSLSGFTFTPPNAVVDITTESATAVNFTASPTVYNISGTVTVSGTGLAGVTLTLSDGAGSTATTNASGAYVFSDIVNGTYTVVPTLFGYTFSPANATADISNAHDTVDFTASVTDVNTTLSANPVTTSHGGSTTLSWSSTNADGASIDQGIGVVDVTGTRTVTPAVTTNYTMTATNSVSGASATASVTVTPYYDITGTVSLTAPGLTDVILTLKDATDTVVATTRPDISGAYAFTDIINGTYTVVPSIIGCSFSPVSRQANLTTGVDAVSMNFAATILHVTTSLAANPVETYHGSRTTLTWTSTNANSVTITPGLNLLAANGSRTVTPAVTTNYEVTASNTFTTRSATANVTVTPYYDIKGKVTLSSPAGMAEVLVTLKDESGTVVDTTSPDASSGIFSFTHRINGIYSVIPSLTGYSFTETQADLTTGVDAYLEIGATVLPVTATLTATPEMPQHGASSTLAWTSSQATDVTMTTDSGTLLSTSLNGSLSVNPAVTTTYRITATNSATTITYHDEVTVTPHYDITGNVNLDRSGQTAVTMTLKDINNAVVMTVHPDASGNYAFPNIPNGQYTVTPKLIGYSFTPALETVDLTTGSDATVNFGSTVLPVTASLIAEPEWIMEGSSTKLTWTSTQANVMIIDPDLGMGDVPAFGESIQSPVDTTTYTITASNSYTGELATASVIVTVTHVYDISGTVSGAGVVNVILSGKTDMVVQSDSSGNYAFLNIEEGSYSLSAYKEGYTFGYNIIKLDQDLTHINLAAMTPWSGNKQFGSAAEDNAWAIHKDMNGNVFVAGNTWGALGSANEGSSDAYLRKYSASGALLWTRQIGSTLSDYGDGDYAYAIATDTDGNVYMTGFTYGDMGASSNGKVDVYVIKYNSDGTLQWNKQMGTAESEIAYGIAVFENYLYITGVTNGDMDGSPNHPFGLDDMFLSQYSTLDGTLNWTREQGYRGTDKGMGVAVSLIGEVYVAGYTNDVLEGEVYSGNGDIFLSKFDSTGLLVWTRLVGSPEADMGSSLTVSSAGDIYIGAQTKGTIAPDSENQGLYDYLIAKYDSEGMQQWVHQSGSAGDDVVMGISSFGANSIYLTGHTDGNLGGFTSAGLKDLFVVKYDADGAEQWIRMAGTDRNDYGRSISAQATDALFIAGLTEGGQFTGGASDEDHDAFIVNVPLTGALKGTYDEETTFLLTVNNGSGDGSFQVGTTTTITANTAPAGKDFDQWVVDSGNPQIQNIYEPTTEVRIGSTAMVVTATYKDPLIMTYALTVINGSGSGSYEEGETTNITANAAPAGEEFNVWVINSGSPVVTNVNAQSTGLTMVASAATVTATYKTLSATTYTLTVYNGTGSGSYTSGTTIPITADTAPSGQVFDGWEVDFGSPSVANASIMSTSLTMPLNAAAVTATYRDLPTSNNLVLPANGGLLVSFTSEYGANQRASYLTNGAIDDVGWSTQLTPHVPQAFVYSFDGGERATVDEAVIYSSAADGPYFCEDVEVWTSMDGVTYTIAANGTLAQGEHALSLSLGNKLAKTVKLIVTSGYRTDYWKLSEFEVYGVLEEAQPNIETFQSNDGLKEITLQASEGTIVVEAMATDVPSTPPAGAEFPYGVFEFTLDNIGVGGSTTVTLYLPSDAAPTSYYKYGRTPDDDTDHWYEFLYDAVTGTGALINGNVITLHFVDGLRGDDDLDGSNGVIVDPGAPSMTFTTGSEDTPDGGDPENHGDSENSVDEGSGGSCFIESLFHP